MVAEIVPSIFSIRMCFTSLIILSTLTWPRPFGAPFFRWEGNLPKISSSSHCITPAILACEGAVDIVFFTYCFLLLCSQRIHSLLSQLSLHFSSKRGIDFGLGRGYSGNQAAKHFMGLVASQYAGGPGKKRKRNMTGSNLQQLIDSATSSR